MDKKSYRLMRFADVRSCLRAFAIRPAFAATCSILQTCASASNRTAAPIPEHRRTNTSVTSRRPCAKLEIPLMTCPTSWPMLSSRSPLPPSVCWRTWWIVLLARRANLLDPVNPRQGDDLTSTFDAFFCWLLDLDSMSVTAGSPIIADREKLSEHPEPGRRPSWLRLSVVVGWCRSPPRPRRRSAGAIQVRKGGRASASTGTESLPPPCCRPRHWS